MKDEIKNWCGHDSLHELVRPAMDGLTKKTDDVFIEAINRAIGKGWTIAELKGRCESIKREGDSYEVIHLDGTPILELHEIETTTDFSEMKSTIAWKRDYRFLIPSNDLRDPRGEHH